MARNTNPRLKNMMLYQIFVRQYSNTHDFKGVTKDLSRIKELGTDIIYLTPIQPIGEKNRKGSIGSPYSIKNYREIDPLYGTVDDFKELLNAAHEKDMYVILDVVYNHTSRDSYLLETHPEYFYRDKFGNFNNKVGEWWDVTDLDFNNKDLWKELIDTLCYWVSLGVDGFRCDVASAVPLEFWKEARRNLEMMNPNIIMLAETVHPNFIKAMRNLGFTALTDYEAYEAFDIEYDFDIIDEIRGYIVGEFNLNSMLKAYSYQEARYPVNYIKAHYYNNHDVERMNKYITNMDRRINMYAMLFFLKGTTFIYAGDEALCTHRPDLFEYDVVDFSGLKNSPLPKLFKTLSNIKKDDIFSNGAYDIKLNDLGVAHIEYQKDNIKYIGIFNPDLVSGTLFLEGVSGTYLNLIDQKEITISETLEVQTNPIIIKVE